MDLLNGKVTIIVMMKTTMQDAIGMEEIAVVIMSTQNIVHLANAWIQIIQTMDQLFHHFK